MKSTAFLFVNASNIYQFKWKVCEIEKYPLRLRNISKDFVVNNMIKTGLNGRSYNFSVNYKTSDISGIAKVYKYLMKIHDIKQC